MGRLVEVTKFIVGIVAVVESDRVFRRITSRRGEDGSLLVCCSAGVSTILEILSIFFVARSIATRSLAVWHACHSSEEHMKMRARSQQGRDYLEIIGDPYPF